MVGGSGGLGRALISQLRSSAGVDLVINVGRHESHEAHKNVIVSDSTIYTDIALQNTVRELLEDGPFNAVFCVSGGWRGGNVASDSVLSDFAEMHQSSLIMGVFSCKIAS